MHALHARTITALMVSWSGGVVAAVLIPGSPPSASGVAVALSCAVIGVWLRWWWVVGAALGVTHALVAINDGIEQRLAPCLDGATALIVGRVAGLPSQGERHVRFELDVESLESHADCGARFPQRVRLSWFRGPHVAPGESWRVLVQLRAPRGTVNYGAFDYERWLFTRGIGATGYVQSGRRIDAVSGDRVDAWRLRMRERLQALDIAEAGILLALTTGDGALIPPERWPVFRATGTVHLMVISGLHVGFVGGLGLLLGRGLASIVPALSSRWPPRQSGAVVALAAITAYGFCAGWGLPVQRAWLMTAVGLVWLMSARRIHPWYPFWAAVVVVLWFDPLAPLAAGFWLSFGAVAVLLVHFLPRIEPLTAVLGMIRAQVVLFVCMAPLLVATVGQLPLTAPLANLIAVPVVTLVIVPFALLGSALLSVAPALATGTLSVSGWAAVALVAWLEALSSLAEPMEGFAPDVLALALASTGAALWLVPLPLRWRVLSLPLLSALFQPALPPPAFGEFRLRMLDVGQGLAVVVDTARHRLIYDAGPRFASGFDAGESIVVPAVRARGGRQASLLMISHDHADHAGGGEAVRRALTVRHWQGGGGFSARPLHAFCRAGDRWQWDGVEFEVLYPREPWRLSANDGSCVLEIRNGRHAVLLPGDIEVRAEAALVRRQLLQPVDILVAPHHGSRTSSTPAFLNALRPAVVLVSSGHRNRYGHPHDIVMARYHARSARVYVTAASGEIGWDSAQPGRVAEYRAADRRYWRAPAEPLPNAGGGAAP